MVKIDFADPTNWLLNNPDGEISIVNNNGLEGKIKKDGEVIGKVYGKKVSDIVKEFDFWFRRNYLM